MKRAITVVVVLLVPAALVGLIVSRQARLPPEWQAGLDEYVDHLEARSSGPVDVRTVVQARDPTRFGRDMSRAVTGESVIFQTDYDYTGEADSGGARPLPFPPEEVWCVLLERDLSALDGVTSDTGYAVLFVALHQDMYNAEWMIHWGTDDVFAPDFRERLSEIGCELELERLAQ